MSGSPQGPETLRRREGAIACLDFELGMADSTIRSSLPYTGLGRLLPHLLYLQLVHLLPYSGWSQGR
jgi:hypothetical protein